MPIVDGGGTLGGVPVLKGHRIGVHHVVDLILHGDESVESVAAEVYPQLSEQEVYDAIEFAMQNPHRMEAVRRELGQEKRRLQDNAATGLGDIPNEFRD